MKTGLLLKENGELTEIKFKIPKDTFDIADFSEYNCHKTYDNYIVLYNTEKDMLNISVLPFTEDKFNGDILLIKIDAKLEINNFTVDKYLKILLKNKSEENDLYYSSDEDEELIQDRNLFCL